MAKILVTGVSGYVGAALAPRLLSDGHEVRGLSRRPSDAGERLGIPMVAGRRRHRRRVSTGRSTASTSPTT